MAITLFSLIGVFGFVFGGQSLYWIRTSPVVHAVGIIDHVVVTQGKGDHYWFTFTTSSGRYRLSADYGGSGIQDGEIVDISFLEKPGTLTYLRVLDPPNHRGLVLHEGDGTRNAWVTFLIGLGCFIQVIFLIHKKTTTEVALKAPKI